MTVRVNGCFVFATFPLQAFCEAINSVARQQSNAQLREMIGACSTFHGQLTKEATMGKLVCHTPTRSSFGAHGA